MKVIDGTLRTTGVQTVTADYSVTEDDYAVLVNAAGGAVTVTLPTGVAGQMHVIKKIDDSGTNALTITGSANIDGSAALEITGEMSSAAVQFIDSAWYVTAEKVVVM